MAQTYTFDSNIVSDLHKDARGFRPSVDWLNEWKATTDEDRQMIWDGLMRESELAFQEEQRIQAEAVAEFEQHILETIRCGANDRKTAMRWILSNVEHDGDPSFACFLLGLPYNMSSELKEVI